MIVILTLINNIDDNNTNDSNTDAIKTDDNKAY